MVQLREKGDNLMEVKSKALTLREILKPYHIPLIINDHVELAAEIDADGVHIGKHDMDLESVLKIIGTKKYIGVSIEDLSQLDAINRVKGNIYVTASAVYPSKTKPNCEKLWGLEGVEKIVKLSAHPVTAIGGMRLNNAHAVRRAGACGVAVVGAFHDAKDPEEESRAWKKTMHEDL